MYKEKKNIKDPTKRQKMTTSTKVCKTAGKKKQKATTKKEKVAAVI